MQGANQLEIKDDQRAKQSLVQWASQEDKVNLTQVKQEGGSITT